MLFLMCLIGQNCPEGFKDFAVGSGFLVLPVTLLNISQNQTYTTSIGGICLIIFSLYFFQFMKRSFINHQIRR